MSEFEDTSREYSNRISFNDVPHFRNKNYSLFQMETMNIYPTNYSEDVVSKYDKVFTWNFKNYESLWARGINAVKVPALPLFDNYTVLEEFINPEEKDGVCLICRHRVNNAFTYDMCGKRAEVFQNLEGMTKHAYGKVPYCGENYQGVIGESFEETWPGSMAKLKTLNKYKFNICFENCYHEHWSWDYVTEKIIDCFKAKTVPVYYGCYNIEEHIPKELYIDYREFKNDSELNECLLNFDDTKYIEMIESAHKWINENKVGDIEEFKKVLNEN